MAASSTGWYFTYKFSRKSVDTLYSHLMEVYSFSVKSTDYGQISFNNLGKVEKNVKTNIFMDFSMDFVRDFFMK